MAKKSTGKIQEEALGTVGNGSNANRTGAHDNKISQEQIALRAYQIYEREGRGDGHDMEHWLRAEQELRLERQNQMPEEEMPSDRREALAQRPEQPVQRQEQARSARRHTQASAI